ncbi:MAG: NAD-binding protein [Bacilli bacterium]|jgi:trk system potassium uptake protein TrkA|nr:NAD-binding protein [Bacilli bacterium]
MKRDRVLIVGCSRFGASIATNLSLKGENVVVLDEQNNSFRKLDDSFSGYEMVGNGLDLDVLKESGIEQSKMLISSTDDDNINIFIAEVAAIIFLVPDIYVRLNDPSKAIVLEHLNVKIIYPFELSMNEFERMRSEGV